MLREVGGKRKMNHFMKACRRRPMSLWCILFFVFFVCTLIVQLVRYQHGSPKILFIYWYMIFPILHLWLFCKPLTFFEMIHILFIYCAILIPLSMNLCSALWYGISIWIYFGLVFILLSLAIIFLILDAVVYLKQNEQYLE